MGLCCGCTGLGGDHATTITTTGKPLSNKGTDAVKRVRKAFKNVESLEEAMKRQDDEVDISSCSATATLLGGIVSSKQLKLLPDFDRNKNAKDWSAMIDLAAPLLDGPHMVYFAVVPDHHFIVVPIDDGHVCILQGFQGAFNLVEWLGQETVFDKDEFVDAMRDLVSSNERKKIAAALKLFSFEGVVDKITDWYESKQVWIHTCAYKEL
jgi:hypothetical protein